MNEVKMNELTTLYKPDGMEVRVNEKSLEHALSLGWTREEPEEPKKRGRPPKEVE